MGDRPTGTVTFLFTDIEGSTRLWEESPDAMRAALARHDQIVRSAIEERGGYVFATGGDGFAAAFGSVGDGVAAAVAAQAGLPRSRGMTRRPYERGWGCISARSRSVTVTTSARTSTAPPG